MNYTLLSIDDDNDHYLKLCNFFKELPVYIKICNNDILDCYGEHCKQLEKKYKKHNRKYTDE